MTIGVYLAKLTIFHASSSVLSIGTLNPSASASRAPVDAGQFRTQADQCPSISGGTLSLLAPHHPFLIRNPDQGIDATEFNCCYAILHGVVLQN